MATPTRSQAVSTPKNPLSTTPSKPMASPRPGTGTGTAATAYKSLAYKSPAVKTPASVPGHGHHVSVSSSQPSSTPLAAAAIHDELLALNSPAAALINSIGIAPTGLTPLPTGQDGLGITTTHLQGAEPGRDGHPARNPELERLQRLQQVANTLKTKVIGQGITREGVERVARLQGFEPLWDEDNLTIAGNVVELDMTFDPFSTTRVKDLVLKLNSANGESKVQPRATTILKKDLGVGHRSDYSPVEDNLEAFSTNLQYLSQLDHVDPTTNCFEIVGGLYNTFRSIWHEEQNRRRLRDNYFHLCNGSVGKPTMDRKPKLGLCVDYWKARHGDSSAPASDDLESSDEVGVEQERKTWRGRFSCESGSPSITSAQKWVSDDILTKQLQPENMLDADEEMWIPDWQDPVSQPVTTIDDPKEDEHAMSVDKPNPDLPRSLSVGFVCTLEPYILVPVNASIELNSEITVVGIDQAQAITYQQALQTARNRRLSPQDADHVEARWSRSLQYVDPAGKRSTHAHSYALYPAPLGAELWFFPVSKLRFNHPRQIAATLPTLRQYAVLWSLLSNIMIDITLPIAGSPERKGDRRQEAKRQVVKRSNKKPASNTKISSGESITSIDISLDVLSDPAKPKLSLFVPTVQNTDEDGRDPFLHLSIAVGAGGKIEVVELEGSADSGTTNLQSKVQRMLALTEDPGMVVQWLLQRLRS